MDLGLTEGKSFSHFNIRIKLTYSHSYWNTPYEPDNYNFVQYAVNKGYSVFFYDRLGVGGSTKYANPDISIL